MQECSNPIYQNSTLDPDWVDDYQQPAEKRCCNHGGRPRVKLILPVLISGLLLLAVVITTRTIGFSTDSQSRCDSDWIQHGEKCYYLSKQRVNWNQSYNECVHMRSHLAVITNIDEQRFLMEEIQRNMQYVNDKFWIGLTDMHKEGEWRWVDNRTLDRSKQFWVKSQPDDWGRNNPQGEDCARMGLLDFNGKDVRGWFDARCPVLMKYICETPIY